MWKRNLKGTIYMTNIYYILESEMIVEIGMLGAFTLF